MIIFFNNTSFLLRLFIIRKCAALYDVTRVHMFIRFAAKPPYTIFIWPTFISKPLLTIFTSLELPFYRPVACLETHPAGVPGNCHLPASLSLRSTGIWKLLLAWCLRIWNKLAHGLIHNSCVCLSGLINQHINKYSVSAFCRGEVNFSTLYYY